VSALARSVNPEAPRRNLGRGRKRDLRARSGWDTHSCDRSPIGEVAPCDLVIDHGPSVVSHGFASVDQRPVQPVRRRCRRTVPSRRKPTGPGPRVHLGLKAITLTGGISEWDVFTGEPIDLGYDARFLASALKQRTVEFGTTKSKPSKKRPLRSPPRRT
jgi:hypothetical protein